MGNLTDEEISEYEEVFKTYDKNGDGSLSFQELVRMARDLGWTEDMISDAELADIFIEIDKDGSKCLSMEEFLSVFSKRSRSEITESNLRRAFHDIDHDKSGEIDASELKKVLCGFGESYSDDEISTMIAKVDTSGDGKISIEEFLAIWKS